MSNKESGCPVKGEDSNDACPVKGGGCGVEEKEASPSMFSNTYSLLFGNKKSETKETKEIAEEKGYNPRANDMKFGNEVQDGQRIALSKKRVISTILKSDITPAHQPDNFERWVYPSEQQYYNAMTRKGYHAQEEDIGVILAIHNMVNEKGWSQIKEWEEMRGCKQPKLKKFLGRPKDISPKAYLMNLLGYSLPFDRHDWVVDSNGEEVRYVIDFYTGAPAVSSQTGQTAPVSMHLDVRPAIDSPQAVYYRLKHGAMEWVNSLNLSALLKVVGGSSGSGSGSAGSDEGKK